MRTLPACALRRRNEKSPLISQKEPFAGKACVDSEGRKEEDKQEALVYASIALIFGAIITALSGDSNQ